MQNNADIIVAAKIVPPPPVVYTPGFDAGLFFETEEKFTNLLSQCSGKGDWSSALVKFHHSFAHGVISTKSAAERKAKICLSHLTIDYFTRALYPLSYSIKKYWDRLDRIKQIMEDIIKSEGVESGYLDFVNLSTELSDRIKKLDKRDLSILCLPPDDFGNPYLKHCSTDCFPDLFHNGVSLYSAYKTMLETVSIAILSVPHGGFNYAFPQAPPIEKASIVFGMGFDCFMCANRIVVEVKFCEAHHSEPMCWSCFRKHAWAPQHDEHRCFEDPQEVRCPHRCNVYTLEELKERMELTLYLDKTKVKPLNLRKKRLLEPRKGSQSKKQKSHITLSSSSNDRAEVEDIPPGDLVIPSPPPVPHLKPLYGKYSE